jgi:chromatin-remodeling ATPase INO80
LLQKIKESVKTRAKMIKLKKDIEKITTEGSVETDSGMKGRKKISKTITKEKETGKKSKKIKNASAIEQDGQVTNLPSVTQEEEAQFSVSGLPEDEAREALWRHISRKQIPKVVRSIHQGTSARLFNCKKLAQATSGLVKRQNSRLAGKPVTAARRAMKEMLAFWKKNEREERDLRKRAEKEAAERRRIEEEQREARRQAKKLNFLITQTELYSHFVGRKQHQGNTSTAAALSKDTDFADVDDSVIHAEAERIAKNAAAAHQAKLEQFQATNHTQANDMDFMNPSTLKDATILEQPTLMQVTLKSYQLKGLTWLASLYEQVTNS